MTETEVHLRPLTIEDYNEVTELLTQTEGVGLRDADSIEGIARYLARNPGMSFIAEADGSIAGCVFGGHDGRRGYLYHLAVLPRFRRLGAGRSLVARVIATIAADGIEKFHIDVYRDNAEGLRFWQALGWHERGDLKRLSIIPSGRSNN